MISLLNYREDIWNFYWAFLGPIILIIPFFIDFPNVISMIFCWGIVFALICRHNYMLHNHIHSRLTPRKSLNKILDILYGLCSGMPAGNWKIMHVHGHHVEHKVENLKSRQYLKIFEVPTLKEGEKVSGVWYSAKRIPAQIVIPIFILFNGLYSVSKDKRKWSVYYLLDYFAIFLFCGTLFIISPVKASLFLGVTYLMVYFVSIYVDFYTHVQSEKQTDSKISFSNICHNPAYNKAFWNFGYHVAHHSSPVAHWTKLPEMERKMGVGPSDEEAHKALNIYGFFSPKFYSWKVPKWQKK